MEVFLKKFKNMIKICTIHYKTEKFLNLQYDNLEKFTNNDYKIFCGIDGIKLNNPKNNVTYLDLSKQNTTHAFRLNDLYNIANLESDDNDILIFMDSDCFPIQNWVDYILEKLKINPIVAIQRFENFSAPLGCIPEVHPHPCFFSTTFGFWRQHNLSFDNTETAGYSLINFLMSKNLDFYKLLRSNTVNIHPLMFGVYDDIFYHHGAGNRPPYDGVDICLRKRLGHGTELDLFYPQILKFNQKLSDLVYEEIINDQNYIKNYLLGLP